MTLLANKIFELVEETLISPERQIIWRGHLDANNSNSQIWKIVVTFPVYDENNVPEEVHVRAVRRDGGQGDPE